MKTVELICDSCGAALKNTSVAHTVFSGSLRRDFCGDACFTDWKRRTSAPAQTTFGVEALLKFEPATDWDIWTVHDWNNDPEVRSRSFSTASIPRTAHQEWFAAHRQNITMAWRAVGCARVEDGEVSVVVDPDHRGKGYGSKLIKAVAEPNVRARIKESNFSSLAAFKNACFTEIGRENGVVEMVWPGLH